MNPVWMLLFLAKKVTNPPTSRGRWFWAPQSKQDFGATAKEEVPLIQRTEHDSTQLSYTFCTSQVNLLETRFSNTLQEAYVRKI